MHMTFTKTYLGTPILFDQWMPKSEGWYIGSMVVIGVAAFAMRALIFIKAHLNAEVWTKGPKDVAPQISILSDTDSIEGGK